MLSFCFVGIRRFSTISRSEYMRKYLPEKLTGPNTCMLLLGTVFRCYFVWFVFTWSIV